MPAPSSPPAPPPGKFARVAFVALMAALGVGLVFGCRELWSRPWYRWFPLALAAAGWLGWRGWKDSQDLGGRSTPGPRRVAQGCFAAAWLVLLLAAVLRQPGLTLWALLLAGLGLAVSTGGWELAFYSVPAFAMLLAIAPPPFELDLRAVKLAERFVLAGADRLLTSFAVPHLRETNGIELAALTIPTADLLPGLCGLAGVAGVCLTALLGMRRSAWRIGLALGALAVLAVPVEILRVTWGLRHSDASGINFFLGLRSDVAMVGVWLAVALVVLALDQLLEFLVHLRDSQSGFHSPDYWRLLLALPAVAALLAAVGFGVYLWMWEPSRARVQIIEAAESDFKAGQPARALLGYRGALRLQAKAEALYQYRVALCLAALGRTEEAVKLLVDLAPVDKPGYGPAQTLLAGELLKIATKPEHYATAEAHLNRALELDARDTDAHAALGRLYVRLGRWDEARSELKEAVNKYPELALGLAVAEQGRRDEAASHSWAERAYKHFTGKLDQAAAKDDPESRIGAAKSLGMLGNFEGAVALLRAGSSKSANPAYAAGLAEVCVHWVSSLERKQPQALAERLQAIQIGLAAAPANTFLLQALARLTALTGPEGDAARQVVTETLAKGTNAPALHFCLGILAWQQGQQERARTHLEAAYAATPDLPDLANNLAATLLTGNKPDPTRALAIVGPLAARFPDNPYYRDTRGQALLALGRPREALLDFEFALPKLADQEPAHRALAEIYRQLDMPELAAAHTRLAKTNAASTKVPAPPR